MRNIFQRRDLYLQRIPELKSILVVTSSYPNHPGFQGNPSGKPSGRIARYAVGRDYHRVIRKQLKQLSSFLMEWAGPSAKTWIAVDTSPVPERVLAQAAGLGFIGKNTCLIQPRGGSYHLLAALLTNVELPSDVPIRWDCGSCTLCLQACPTQALVKPYQLDANRCISSVTIEQRSSIPENLRPLLKDWIFGCDICQEVCPYNKKPETAIPCQDFQPETGAGEKLPLDEILALRTESAFLRRFAGTPLMRAKREGLVRNAAVAAGNSQAPELSASLADAAQNDPSAIVREHAAWGFQQLQKSV